MLKKLLFGLFAVGCILGASHVSANSSQQAGMVMQPDAHVILGQ